MRKMIEERDETYDLLLNNLCRANLRVCSLRAATEDIEDENNGSLVLMKRDERKKEDKGAC